MGQATETMSHVEALEAIGYEPTVHWVCGVVRSGYHNGARCSYSEPHEGWGCAFRAEVSLRLTADEARAAGVYLPVPPGEDTR